MLCSRSPRFKILQTFCYLCETLAVGMRVGAGGSKKSTPLGYFPICPRALFPDFIQWLALSFLPHSLHSAWSRQTDSVAVLSCWVPFILIKKQDSARILKTSNRAQSGRYSVCPVKLLITFSSQPYHVLLRAKHRVSTLTFFHIDDISYKNDFPLSVVWISALDYCSCRVVPSGLLLSSAGAGCSTDLITNLLSLLEQLPAEDKFFVLLSFDE